MGIAFFDMDKTLLAVNSGVLWVRREAAVGRLSTRQAATALWWLARYHLGFASADAMLAEATAALAGTSADELKTRTRAFYANEIQSSFRPKGLEVLAEHRKRGDRCVLLTSSTNYMADLVTKQLSLDDARCNTLEVDDAGRHTGRVVGRLCFGVGKLVHAEDVAQRAGVSLSQCAFYTDSYADVSVLEAVGTPVCVNPDVRLRRHAGKRGWPVADWGVPALP